MIHLDVQIVCESQDLPEQAVLHRWCVAALADEVVSQEVADIELTARFVDATESRALNQQFRNKDAPTNVLSFENDLPPGLTYEDLGSRQLGDIVICLPVVLCEARQQDKPYLAHLAHIFIHGVLHLCGYDHINAHDADVMEAREVQVMASLGWQSPYLIDSQT